MIYYYRKFLLYDFLRLNHDFLVQQRSNHQNDHLFGDWSNSEFPCCVETDGTFSNIGDVIDSTVSFDLSDKVFVVESNDLLVFSVVEHLDAIG